MKARNSPLLALLPGETISITAHELTVAMAHADPVCLPHINVHLGTPDHSSTGRDLGYRQTAALAGLVSLRQDSLKAMTSGTGPRTDCSAVRNNRAAIAPVLRAFA